jgi:hypothetical protein
MLLKREKSNQRDAMIVTICELKRDKFGESNMVALLNLFLQKGKYELLYRVYTLATTAIRDKWLYSYDFRQYFCYLIENQRITRLLSHSSIRMINHFQVLKNIDSLYLLNFSDEEEIEIPKEILIPALFIYVYSY